MNITSFNSLISVKPICSDILDLIDRSKCLNCSRTLEQSTVFEVSRSEFNKWVPRFLLHARNEGVSPRLRSVWIWVLSDGGMQPYHGRTWLICSIRRLMVLNFFVEMDWADRIPPWRGATKKRRSFAVFLMEGMICKIWSLMLMEAVQSTFFYPRMTYILKYPSWLAERRAWCFSSGTSSLLNVHTPMQLASTLL